MLQLSLLGIISCNKYPSDANLIIEADSSGYRMYGESAGYRSKFGLINNPNWLANIMTEIKVQVSIEKMGNSRVLYEGYYLDEKHNSHQ